MLSSPGKHGHGESEKTGFGPVSGCDGPPADSCRRAGPQLTVDKFLQNQQTGKVVDSANRFRVDRARSRDTLLQSIPEGEVRSVYRLLDGAAHCLGERLGMTVSETISEQPNHGILSFHLPPLEPAFVDAYLDELRRPFGPFSGVSLLARATLRGTKFHSRVDINLGSTTFSAMRYDITLGPDSLEIPSSLSATSPGLRINFYPSSTSEYRKHRQSSGRKLYDMLRNPERLLPLESISREVHGYFDYRTKPFTAIRSYACVALEDPSPSMRLDLWDGPYERLDATTVILMKKRKGSFLFLTWRPNYGTPTFIHHFLDSDLSFQKHWVKATFWVETSDRPAPIHFFSKGMVSDPVPVKGPPGLTGLVLWPDLKYDIWGTRMVEDESFREALDWSQIRVDATSRCLADNLDKVIARLRCSNLVGSSYLDETIKKIEGLWGKGST